MAQFFFASRRGEGPKDKNINSQLQSQFQRFLNQTLCVFSQMKDINHIRQDLRSVAWVIPQGWDLGVPWRGLKKFFFFEIHPEYGKGP